VHEDNKERIKITAGIKTRLKFLILIIFIS